MQSLSCAVDNWEELLYNKRAVYALIVKWI